MTAGNGYHFYILPSRKTHYVTRFSDQIRSKHAVEGEMTIPGGDRAPVNDCMSCRAIGCAVLTGSGLYTIYSSLQANTKSPLWGAQSASASNYSPASTSSHLTSIPESQAQKAPAMRSAERPFTPRLGLDTQGFRRGVAGPLVGRGLMAGFGARACRS
jgi:hypothetical protein